MCLSNSLSSSLNMMLLNKGLRPLESYFSTHLKKSPVHYTNVKILKYQTYYLSIIYGATEYFYLFAMTYRIKEAFKVEVNIHYNLHSLSLVPFEGHHGSPSEDGNRNLSWKRDYIKINCTQKIRYKTFKVQYILRQPLLAL